MGGVLLTRGGSEPTPTPTARPDERAVDRRRPPPRRRSCPRSAQPLANDVIVWPRRVGDNWDITTISTDGTVGAQLTDSPEEDNFPVVSPDRRTIVYLHRTSPTSREVRVMGADGSGDRALFATRAARLHRRHPARLQRAASCAWCCPASTPPPAPRR